MNMTSRQSVSAALRLEGVSKSYRRSHLWRREESAAVRDLTFTIDKGEVFGLLGLNGSGKTTTLKLILGLLRPDSGRVEVLGTPMPDRAVLGRVGYLPEAGYMNRHLTGREALDLLAGLSGVASPRQGRIAALLAQVGLSRAADRRIGEYSKGMTQRASIAQALAHQPDLFLLDEPLSGLDPLAMREMRELIAWLKAQGKTLLVSSHDIGEMARVCDAVAILSRGRLARAARRAEWDGRPERLEELFVQTVRAADDYEPMRFS